MHFMQIRWKCAHFPENARILCKLDENARIFLKMRAFYANENARILLKMRENARILLKMRAFCTKDLTQ